MKNLPPAPVFSRSAVVRLRGHDGDGDLLAVGGGVLAALPVLGAEDGLAERGLGGVDLEVVLSGTLAAGTDEEGLLGVLVAVVVGADDGADERDTGLGGRLADLGVGQQVVDGPDAGLLLALLLTRGVVAGVLLEVALLAPLVDLGGDDRTVGDRTIPGSTSGPGCRSP